MEIWPVYIFCLPTSSLKTFQEYKIIILPIVLYGWEILSLTLKEGQEWRVRKISVSNILRL